MNLTPFDALTEALRVLGESPLGVEDLRVAGRERLIESSRLAGELRRIADSYTAMAAGEIARRSAPELGGAGLVQSQGSRTVEEFLKTTTGASGRDAATAVRVGRLTQIDDDIVGSRVAAGSVSVQAAEAIRAGLSGAAADPGLLAEATGLLCDEALSLDPDRLLKRAREVRDELDEAGIADREALLRSRRSIRRIDLRDGMRRIIWDYDPETAGVVDDVYDRATSPRRGGPRFVDSEMSARASELERDERTIEQIASDAFTELLRQAGGLDPAVLVGKGVPAVKVLVSAESLSNGTGHGVIEGTNEVLSIAAMERLACANGTRTVLVDSVGQVLDLGREQRLYSANQRLALAARDGGCLWPGCDRPPAWTEAHHIDHWARDGGRTDLDRGVLLCRHHHLKLHNEHWSIRLRAGRYWLEPPPGSVKPGAMLETRSRAVRELLGRGARRSASQARAAGAVAGGPAKAH